MNHKCALDKKHNMDYYYYHKEQGNYLDSNTSRYCKYKLYLALNITFKLKEWQKKKKIKNSINSSTESFRFSSLNVYTSRITTVTSF